MKKWLGIAMFAVAGILVYILVRPDQEETVEENPNDLSSHGTYETGIRADERILTAIETARKNILNVASANYSATKSWIKSAFDQLIVIAKAYGAETQVLSFMESTREALYNSVNSSDVSFIKSNINTQFDKLISNLSKYKL